VPQTSETREPQNAERNGAGVRACPAGRSGLPKKNSYFTLDRSS